MPCASPTRAQHLEDVIVFLYGANDHFLGRIDAQLRAAGECSAWLLNDAWVSGHRRRARCITPTYDLPTTLTPAQIQESFASPDTLSFWDLPGFIRAAQAAGFSATRYQLYLYTLLCPARCCSRRWCSWRRASRCGWRAMAASPRSSCSAPLAGFGVYFFSDLTRVLGQSGALPVLLAATAPAIASILIGMTLVFNQEDG